MTRYFLSDLKNVLRDKKLNTLLMNFFRYQSKNIMKVEVVFLLKHLFKKVILL